MTYASLLYLKREKHILEGTPISRKELGQPSTVLRKSEYDLDEIGVLQIEAAVQQFHFQVPERLQLRPITMIHLEDIL